MAQRVLVVEDDKDLSRLIRYNFEKAGYGCQVAYDGEEALTILRKSAPDLVILDVMLPGMDGFEVCRRLRQDTKFQSLPVLMLTAKGEEVDRIVGLELGADDYLVKPFSPRELILRAKAILRRAKSSVPDRDVLTEGTLQVDISGHLVKVNKKIVELAPREFDLLVLLMRRKGRVQSREALLADVWDIHTEVSTRTVDTHIKRLREKLGPAGNLIETVLGVGYRFKEDSDEN